MLRMQYLPLAIFEAFLPILVVDFVTTFLLSTFLELIDQGS